MKIAVIGLGKAGLPLAAVIADKNIVVFGIDIDESKVKQINSGKNPIKEEPGLSKLLEKHGGKTLKATTKIEDAKDAAVFIVVVPLFIDKDKKPDFSLLKTAFTKVSMVLKKKDLVVLETTVPVTTTETFVKNILEKGSGLVAGKDFFLAHSPERIMTGHSISRFKEFPKLVGGITKESTDRAYEVYSRFSNPIKVSNARTAELAKISEGVYRDVNIALANELFKVSQEFDINFWEMREMAKHEFCNILEPGNVGGHCIPVYPWFLINELDVPLIKAARELNDEMIEYYVEQIEKHGGKKIGVVGLSFREGVKEKAYSRSIKLIEILRNKGYVVSGKDPLYSSEEIEKEFGIKSFENFEEMDCIIIMNKYPEYIEDLKNIRHKIIDVKNTLS